MTKIDLGYTKQDLIDLKRLEETVTPCLDDVINNNIAPSNHRL